MSRHLSHRLTTIHRAVSTALLCSVGCATLISGAQAAIIGNTVVTSAQHEPLAASIAVTDIRASDFSADLANSTVYQQMGLTPTDSMSVQFKPTSATSGQVIITTSQPVSKPFADLVLSINDKGKRNVVPKTLLMPLNDSLPIVTAQNTAATATKKLNLPNVSVNTARPLTVRRGTPPPLISASSSSTNELVLSKSPMPSMQLPTVTSTTSQGNDLAYASSRLDNGRLSNTFDAKNIGSSSSNLTSASRLDNGRLSADKGVMTNSSATKAKAATPTLDFDILNIQVTRQIKPSNQSSIGVMTTAPIVQAVNNNETKASAASTSSTSIATAQANNIPANVKALASSDVTSNTSNNIKNDTAAAQYQVQRNDSLWVIAQQIAQENNLDIPTVMKQIQSQNPNAFINKDADQLKADAKLSLPSYDVIPSQQKLEAAISAQRQQYNRRANAPIAKKTTKTSSKKSVKNTQTNKQRQKPMITKTQKLPKAQFSVLAPGNNGNADGTQEKSASTTGNGISTDVLATLKASRQNAAAQAQRLIDTSSALDGYTQKIQLQNQKLAELQARLKTLRNQ